MVYTPDGDHYLEELTVASEDIAEVRAIDRSGATPLGLNPQLIYRFREVPAGPALRQLLRDGA
eukprot:3050915-Alexandrium_andersonii.AAC.1